LAGRSNNVVRWFFSRLISNILDLRTADFTFWRWLKQEEMLQPITPRFKLPRMEKKFIPTYTPDDVQKLLEVKERRIW
jgi:hypothetical protein